MSGISNCWMAQRTLLRDMKVLFISFAHSLIGFVKCQLCLVKYGNSASSTTGVLVFLRSDKTDSDTLPVLQWLDQVAYIREIYIPTRRVVVTQQYIKMLEDKIEKKITIFPEKDIPKFICKTLFVITKNASDLQYYKLFIKIKKIKNIRIFHGPVTKNIGKNKSKERNNKKYCDKRYADIFVVQSMVEKYYRSAVTQQDLVRIWAIGYPRFYRAQLLLNGNETPILSDKARLLLNRQNDKKKILFAPTHRVDDDAQVQFFDEAFGGMLEETDAIVLVRAHVVDKQNFEKKFVHLRSDRVLYLPPDCVPGSIELMPYVDCLITDYSSIFAESLFFGIPTIFLTRYDDPYLSNVGIAYESSLSMPGPRVGTGVDLAAATRTALCNGALPLDNVIGKRFFGLEGTAGTMNEVWSAVLGTVRNHM